MQNPSLEQWLESISPNPSGSAIRKVSLANNTKSLCRDHSVDSDDSSSHCSSVKSYLELRKPDPEEVLLELGFGPRQDSQKTGRIPERFRHPSKLLPDIDVNKFFEKYGSKLPESNSNPLTPPQTKPKSP